MGNNIQKEEPNQKQHANDDTAISKQSSQSESNLIQSNYKRKGSDTNRISQAATEQYFNNLGHSQLHPKPQPPSIDNDKPDVSQPPSQSESTEQKQTKKVIMSSQLNSNSVMNDTIMNTNVLGTNPHQSTSTSSSNSTDGVSNTQLQNNQTNNIQSDSLKDSFPDEGYSQQIKKSSFLSNPINSYTSDKSDIDIDIKNIFKDQQRTKSILGSRPNSEIDLTDKFTNSNSNETTSYIATLYQNDYELNFYRNGEEIRHSYIAKLITKKVWTPSQKEKTHNSLIIFDWDDTLLCTSFLTPKGVYDENLILTEKDKEKIAKLEFSVLRLLTIAVEKGDVYIITNAGVGWVEFSAEKYYPSIMPLLQKIKIISARGAYEAKFPNDSRRWKHEAFLDMQKKFNSELVTNILCLGDSFIEIEAGHFLAAKFTQAFIKTVKFRESPKPDELNKQLTLVADQFVGIYSAIKNLTIRVEKKKK